MEYVDWLKAQYSGVNLEDMELAKNMAGEASVVTDQSPNFRVEVIDGELTPIPMDYSSVMLEPAGEETTPPLQEAYENFPWWILIAAAVGVYMISGGIHERRR